MSTANATFHAFRESGKWYTTGRGYLSREVFHVALDRASRRVQIVRDNGETFPGLSGPGAEFIFVVISDEEVDYGYPLCLLP